MSVTIVVPVLAAIAGGITYVLAANAKLSEMGRVTFGAGMLVALFAAAQTVVHF